MTTVAGKPQNPRWQWHPGTTQDSRAVKPTDFRSLVPKRESFGHYPKQMIFTARRPHVEKPLGAGVDGSPGPEKTNRVRGRDVLPVLMPPRSRWPRNPWSRVQTCKQIHHSRNRVKPSSPICRCLPSLIFQATLRRLRPCAPHPPQAPSYQSKLPLSSRESYTFIIRIPSSL